MEANETLGQFKKWQTICLTKKTQFVVNHLQQIYNKKILKIRKEINLNYHNKIYHQQQLNKMTLKKDQTQVEIRFLIAKVYLMMDNIY